MKQPSSTGPRLGLFVFLAAAMALYTVNAWNMVLMDPDEARCAQIAKEMLQSGDWLTPRLLGEVYFDKPALFFWMLAGSFRLLGMTDFAARLVAAVGASLMVVGTYRLGRSLLSPRAALWSALILMTCSFMVIGGRFVRMDVWLTAFVTWALVFWARYHFEGGHWRNLLCGYVCLAVAALTKGLIGPLLPAAIVGLFLLFGRQLGELRRLRLITGTAVILLLAGPWFLYMSLHHPGYAGEFFIRHHFQRMTTSTFGHSATPLFLPGVVLAGMLPWTVFLLAGIVWSVRNRKDATIPRAPGLAVCHWWAIVGILPFLVSHTQLVSYVMPAFPALALIAGHYVERLLGRPVDRETRAVFIITFVTMAVSLVVLAVANRQTFNEMPWLTLVRRTVVFVPVLLLTLRYLKRDRAAAALTTVMVGTLAMAVDAGCVEGPGMMRQRSSKQFVEAARRHLADVDLLVIGPTPKFALPYYLNSNVEVRLVNQAAELQKYRNHPKPFLALITSNSLFDRACLQLGDRLQPLAEANDHEYLVKILPPPATAPSQPASRPGR